MARPPSRSVRPHTSRRSRGASATSRVRRFRSQASPHGSLLDYGGLEAGKRVLIPAPREASVTRTQLARGRGAHVVGTADCGAEGPRGSVPTRWSPDRPPPSRVRRPRGPHLRHRRRRRARLVADGFDRRQARLRRRGADSGRTGHDGDLVLSRRTRLLPRSWSSRAWAMTARCVPRSTRCSRWRNLVPRSSGSAGKTRKGACSCRHRRMPRQVEKGAAFRALHEGEPFVIPNPGTPVRPGCWLRWGPRFGQHEFGVRVHARAPGRHGHAGRCRRPIAALDGATDLPVSADLENGYGVEPEAAALAMTRVARAGAVGASIEDWDPTGHCTRRASPPSGSRRRPRPRGASGFAFMLTARPRTTSVGNPDPDNTIARLQAYEAAGADVLFAPGLANPRRRSRRLRGGLETDERAGAPGMSMAEIVEAGAQRSASEGG